MLRHTARALAGIRPHAVSTASTARRHSLLLLKDSRTPQIVRYKRRPSFAFVLASSALAVRSGGCGVRAGGCLRPSRVLYYRNVVENTLADTPSGYIQDPRAHPKGMVSYTKLSRASAAALEALEQEKKLMESEELAYKGYTTRPLQEAKSTVMGTDASEEELQSAVDAVRRELEHHLIPLLGKTVEKPLSAERVLALKWQQRRRRIANRNTPFRPRPPPKEGYAVRVAEDGTEEIFLRPRPRDDAAAAEEAEDEDEDEDSLLLDDVASEALEPSLLTPERVTVTQDDINHARYVLGLGLRRLRRYDEAEELNRLILRSDVYNVDAVESLLELYTGLHDCEKVQSLLAFLEREYDAAAQEGLPVRTSEKEAAGKGSGEAAAETEEAEGAPKVTELSLGEAGGTEPLATPLETAISVLGDMIVEGATRHCAEHGEGATTRFFFQSLSALRTSLHRTYMSLLIEAVFDSLDEQHYVARVELGSNALKKEDDHLILSVVISFLKMLLVSGFVDLVDDPVRLRFQVLCKLHLALRGSGRRGESFRFCEDMLKLYRENSSLYQRRRWEMEERRRQGDACPRVPAAEGQGEEAPFSPLSSSPPPSFPALPLDDMEEAYRSSLFQYLNDRAIDSSAVGREMCLSVMEEFPHAAAPWETLALMLHREDPKRNLPDAILAARRGLQLEPLNLSLILTCANFYKADHRHALYELVMDRYRLICYMLESGAGDDDLRAVATEILEAERNTIETVDEVKAEERHYQRRLLQDEPRLLRSMEEWARMHSETRSHRTFTHQQPVKTPSQELNPFAQRSREQGKAKANAGGALAPRGGSGDAA